MAGAAFDLPFGDQGEEALDLVDPGGTGRREVDMPVRALGRPVADRLGFVGGVVVQDQMNVEVSQDIGLVLVEALDELAGTVASGGTGRSRCRWQRPARRTAIESLKVSLRCGCGLKARSMRRRVAASARHPVVFSPGSRGWFRRRGHRRSFAASPGAWLSASASFAPRGREPQVRTGSSPRSASLQPLRIWDPRQTRGASSMLLCVTLSNSENFVMFTFSRCKTWRPAGFGNAQSEKKTERKAASCRSAQRSICPV